MTLTYSTRFMTLPTVQKAINSEFRMLLIQFHLDHQSKHMYIVLTLFEFLRQKLCICRLQINQTRVQYTCMFSELLSRRKN